MSARLYVITGSHACRSAMLMLAHKGVRYRAVVLPTGLHPLLVRAAGFAGNPIPIREVNGVAHTQLAFLDRLGTVPALRLGSEKIQTNRAIARYLERTVPEAPLFPAEPALRQAVGEAERWGDDVLQMAARRVGLASAAHGLDAMEHRAGDGRLGPLLARSDLVRTLASRASAPAFKASGRNEAQLVADTKPLLDRVDAWIAEGVLNREALNVADFMIAPSLALLTYRADLREEIAARPAGRLVDRILPEPAS